MMTPSPLLSIGDLARRTGLSVSAIRFYEVRGLVSAVRTGGNQRRFPRSDIRRLSFALIAQQLGLTLSEIEAQLVTLPLGRAPTQEDWRAISLRMRQAMDGRIAMLQRTRDLLDGCIGCGCLSLDRCALYNPGDRAAVAGAGPRFLLGDRASDFEPGAANEASLEVTPDPSRQEVEALRQELAVLKARLGEAEELADADVLTPVLNRRAFVRELNRTIAHAARYGAKACLLYFDLDAFKAVNDRFGHLAGDKVLTMVAARLLAHTRKSDVVGRMGGDEFAVILAHTNEAAARTKAAGLVAAIQSAPVAFDGQDILVRVSCGVRMIDPAASADQTLAEADAAMFLRKPARTAEF